MKVLGFEREEEAEIWARQQIKTCIEPEFFRAFSVVDDKDKFALVVVITNFTSRNVDLNIAISDSMFAKHKLAVEIFNELFGYIFTILRAVRVTGLVRSDNLKAKRFNEQMGFKLEGVMREAFEDADLNIYGFLASEYQSHKWFKG